MPKNKISDAINENRKDTRVQPPPPHLTLHLRNLSVIAFRSIRARAVKLRHLMKIDST